MRKMIPPDIPRCVVTLHHKLSLVMTLDCGLDLMRLLKNAEVASPIDIDGETTYVLSDPLRLVMTTITADQISYEEKTDGFDPLKILSPVRVKDKP